MPGQAPNLGTVRELGGVDTTSGYTGTGGSDPLSAGKDAVQTNVQSGNQEGGPRAQFKGNEYFKPESVPGSIAAEGYEAPESVVQASRESEGY